MLRSVAVSFTVWITIAAFLVQACSSPPKMGKASTYTPVSQGTTAESLQKFKDQTDDYNTVIDYCQAQLQGIRQDQRGLSYWLIGIAVLGAALGAAGSALLAASAANASTAALFSAGAGVASGVQPTMAREGATPEFYRKAYDTLWQQLQNDVQEWNNIPRDGTQAQIDKQQKVIEVMNAHCRFIPYPTATSTPPSAH
ncbi:hypothetical protein YTPLAS18_31400 [Nitrospira sp.]|nr:hypothetical protein YTPLAS18_31400 [Nitrospira sp.]